MNIIASTHIQGPEAKGSAKIVQLENNQYQLTLKDFWVAPGAPDVWIAVSPQTHGQPDSSTIDIAPYDYRKTNHELALPEKLSIKEITTIIIYCKKFNAHFGHGILTLENAT